MLLGTSWKMNKTLSEARAYARRVAEFLDKQDNAAPELFIVPSYTSLHVLVEELSGLPVRIGVQNIHWDDDGAYTGEVSARQASDSGATIAEIGHSDRRWLNGETDEDVKKKVTTALKHKLKPLLCLGEPGTERADRTSSEYVRRQLKKAVGHLQPEQAAGIWIAYEPVWAIGDGSEAAEPQYVLEMQDIIRGTLTELFDISTAHSIPILYGGSVNQSNAQDYMRLSHLDGLFVGRFALEPENFLRLARIMSGQIVNGERC